MKKQKEITEIIQPKTNPTLLKVVLTFLANMFFFIFSPNRWRFCLLNYLESDNVEPSNTNFIESGIIMTNSTRTFGVEIEFVHSYDHTDSIYADLKAQFPNWALKNDSSIRPSGTEINSPILSGKEGLKEVEKMIDYLKSNKKIRVNDSCGLHVHVGASDLTPVQVILTSQRYANAEEQFFDRIMEKSRNDNRYCQTTKKNIVKDCIPRSIAGIERIFKDFNHYKVNNRFDKYRKLNILCCHHGTIEFRHHHATLKKAEILNWISFITSFVDSTKKNTENMTVLEDSIFEVKYPENSATKIYKEFVNLCKIIKEETGGLFFYELLQVVTRGHRTFHLSDYERVMADELNQAVIRKIEALGFNLKMVRKKDDHWNEYYNFVTLYHGDTSIKKLLEDPAFDESQIVEATLNKIETRLTEVSKPMELFDNIPNETIFYYANLFEKQNKKIEKAKKAAINLLRERQEQF